MKSVADARLSVEVLARWLRYFGPNSPLGPGVGGMLSVLLTMLLALIAAPIVIWVMAWWWLLWLPFPR